MDISAFNHSCSIDLPVIDDHSLFPLVRAQTPQTYFLLPFLPSLISHLALSLSFPRVLLSSATSCFCSLLSLSLSPSLALPSLALYAKLLMRSTLSLSAWAGFLLRRDRLVSCDGLLSSIAMLLSLLGCTSGCTSGNRPFGADCEERTKCN